MTRVLVVEASSGGVVGGSLTGLYHMVLGLDRSRFTPAFVLYEEKTIEDDLKQIDVPVFRASRQRIPKEHPLLHRSGYRQAKQVSLIKKGLQLGRQSLRMAFEEFPAAITLARTIRSFGADVVHLGNGIRANFDGILAASMTGTPCLCHVKGFEKYSGREQWAAKRLGAVVYMTQAIKSHCEASGVRAARTEVIYDALDENEFRPRGDRAQVRESLGIGENTIGVGVLGNIQEWKGQELLIEAIHRLRPEFPDIKALIVGGVHRSGEAYHRKLKGKLENRGLAELLSFTGFRDDVPDIVNALDVVVHTSIRPEPFGRVILEAMLLGKPVVASAAGGVPELIEHGETGRLFRPGDAGDLAVQLKGLFADRELRQRMGERARQWARERFTLDRHVDEMSRLYDELTRRN